VFIVTLDATILFVAFPSIQASYPGVSPANLSRVLNAYTIVVGAMLVPAGAYADKFGRKKIPHWGAHFYGGLVALRYFTGSMVSDRSTRTARFGGGLSYSDLVVSRIRRLEIRRDFHWISRSSSPEPANC
jgi:MFS family permease